MYPPTPPRSTATSQPIQLWVLPFPIPMDSIMCSPNTPGCGICPGSWFTYQASYSGIYFLIKNNLSKVENNRGRNLKITSGSTYIIHKKKIPKNDLQKKKDHFVSLSFPSNLWTVLATSAEQGSPSLSPKPLPRLP